MASYKRYRLNQSGLEKVKQQVTEAVSYIYSALEKLLDEPRYLELANFINLKSLALYLSDDNDSFGSSERVKINTFNKLSVEHNSVIVDYVKPLIHIAFNKNENQAEPWDITETPLGDQTEEIEQDLQTIVREHYPERQYPVVKVAFGIGNYIAPTANILVVVHMACAVEDYEEELKTNT